MTDLVRFCLACMNDLDRFCAGWVVLLALVALFQATRDYLGARMLVTLFALMLIDD